MPDEYGIDFRKNLANADYEPETIQYDGSVNDKDLFIRQRNPQTESDIPRLTSIYNDGVKARIQRENRLDVAGAKVDWEEAGVATWATKGTVATGLKNFGSGVVDFVTQNPMNHVDNLKDSLQSSVDEAGKSAPIKAAKRMLNNGEISQEEYLDIVGKSDVQTAKDKLYYEDLYKPKADIAYIRNSKNQVAINNLNKVMESDGMKSLIGNKAVADKLNIPVELLKDEEMRLWAVQRLSKINNEDPREIVDIVSTYPGLLNVFQDEKAFVTTPANEIRKMADYESKLTLGIFSNVPLARGGKDAWENSRINDIGFKMLTGVASDDDAGGSYKLLEAQQNNKRIYNDNGGLYIREVTKKDGDSGKNPVDENRKKYCDTDF